MDLSRLRISAGSEVHDLSSFGRMVEIPVHGDLIKHIRDVCNVTDPSAADIPIDCGALHPAFASLLSQLGGVPPQQGLGMTKLPNGYALHSLQGPPSVIVAIIRVQTSDDPERPAPPNSPGVAYILGPHPDATEPPLTFHLVKHNRQTAVQQISRFSTVDHCVAQIRSAISPTEEPRIIFDSPTLGRLWVRNLQSSNADAVKTAFMTFLHTSAVATPKGGQSGLFGEPLKLDPSLAKLLMLRMSKGEVCCESVKGGGILGYRLRENKDRTLIFIATCEEINGYRPADTHESNLEIFKMDYKNSKDDGARIIVVDHNTNIRNLGEVALDMSVQQILNVVEKFFRMHSLRESKFEHFPMFCELMQNAAGAAVPPQGPPPVPPPASQPKGTLHASWQQQQQPQWF